MAQVVNLKTFPRDPVGTVPRRRPLPKGTYRIDRQTRWGNPWEIGRPDPDTGEPMDRARVLQLYLLRTLPELLVTKPDLFEPLRGKDLACWCAPEPCHGDYILRLFDE